MMGKQSDIFLKEEGAAWFRRNKNKIDRKNDPVLAAIREAGIKPEMVFEFGAANGWRLDILRDEFECRAFGCDPGIERGSNLYVDKNTAAHIGWGSNKFDLVIYGFCLYLCDREDLFEIVAEGDRVLKDGGYLVIWDFLPDDAHAVPYKHRDGILSYKMNYANLWLGNPAYSIFYWKNLISEEHANDDTSVTILKKDIGGAWPILIP